MKALPYCATNDLSRCNEMVKQLQDELSAKSAELARLQLENRQLQETVNGLKTDTRNAQRIWQEHVLNENRMRGAAR
jgi:cell division protein FtsB